ncbi:MAG: 16S rRNA (uracil(1498)-N(3))-methyltransferase [Sphingobacteriaceae bacterium]|nr:16S rRNA (uracil(1498)-N(3))-methyltransferase [Cytophagaceae bacterium]
MPVFFQPTIGQESVLSEDESRHAVKVLRMKAGDPLEIADGAGGWYRAEISRADARRCEVCMLSTEHTLPRPFRIHLALAPTKNLDRMEWMLEKCVEIGVDEISFLETRFSERRSLKMERLRQIAISALKQSRQPWLPTLRELRRWGDFLTTLSPTPLGEQRFIAHLDESERKLLIRHAMPGFSYIILVGPEGDFSNEEINQAQAAGFGAVSLGPSRLRTETAGLVAVHTLNLINL